MKIVFTLFIILGTYVLQANDAIKIINTVFHGINTVTNLARPPTVVVTPGSVVTPVVTYPTVVYPQNEVIYLMNGQYMILRNGVYLPYIHLSPPRYYPYSLRYVHPRSVYRPQPKRPRSPPRRRH